MAATFAGKIGLEDLGSLSGLLHDLGKASKEFVSYIKSKTGLLYPDEDDYANQKHAKGKTDHSTAGAQFCWNSISDDSSEASLMVQVLSIVIASHHTGLLDCLDPSGKDNFTTRMNKPHEKTHLDEARCNMDARIRLKVENILSDPAVLQEFNRKIKSLQETNDSKQTFTFKLGLLVRFLFSSLIDADRIDTADFEFPERKQAENLGSYVPWTNLIERFDMHMEGLRSSSNETTVQSSKINATRQNISKLCYEFSDRPKGLYKLTVPTGGGKTLSSLRFALNHAKIHNMDRVFFVIPYTSIIDQNAERIRKALKPLTSEGSDSNDIVLEHHSNLTPEREVARQNILSQNWDSRIVFTTMVKFLETLFGHGTRDARRMHSLANSVIIFDEVQTLPVECVHMFNLSVRFLVQACGSTVVLCTATQPLLDRVHPIQRALKIDPEQEINTNPEATFEELKRIKFQDRRKIGGWSVDEIAAFTRIELGFTGSVLVIVNTKREARDLFQQLEIEKESVIYHLSTNMCPDHRMKVLYAIQRRLENRLPIVCVSTQLIEAGIDIDFSSVIRYLAGMDSITQAAGRCNRNGNLSSLGRFFVINPKGENLDHLNRIRFGREISERMLDDYRDAPGIYDSNIFGTKAIESFYEYFYHKTSDAMRYKVHANSAIGREDDLFNVLSTNSISSENYIRVNHHAPNIILKQSFKTAADAFRVVNSNMRGVIVPYGNGIKIILDLCGSPNLETEHKLLKKAQKYTVDLFENRFQDLEKKGIIHEIQKGKGVFYIDKPYYHPYYGLCDESISGIPLLNP